MLSAISKFSSLLCDGAIDMHLCQSYMAYYTSRVDILALRVQLN